ncbi:Transcription factor bHLH96, partial [Cucurbita argyrosperma subsp. argyrosperma]
MALEAVVFSQDLYTSLELILLCFASYSFPEEPAISRNPPLEAESRTPNPIRPRKRRPKSRKNKEDIENQRMTHIVLNEIGRKQMNEYLSGDQASIIGGAINFVKELEQQVQVLSTMETKTKGCSSSKPLFLSSSPSLSSNQWRVVVHWVKRRPKQALKIVAGLHSLCLSVLHLNISTINQIVLYCLSVKVEDDCKLNSVDEIASALHQLLCRSKKNQ